MRFVGRIAVIFCLLVGAPVKASEPVYFNYEPGLIDDHLDRGKTVVVLFHDFWCQACKQQRAIITEHRRNNARFNSMIFVVVDWAEYSFMPIADELEVSDVATMIVKDRNAEKARMIRVTYEDALNSLLQMGLDW